MEPNEDWSLLVLSPNLAVLQQTGEHRILREMVESSLGLINANGIVAKKGAFPTRLLIVEDDLLTLHTLKELLETPSLTVFTADNGAEGLREVMRDGDFDVVLCDMMMPHMPGDMFYLAVERVRPVLCKRFIFMTGNRPGDGRTGDKIQQFIQRINRTILYKPFLLNQLMDAIAEVLSWNAQLEPPSE